MTSPIMAPGAYDAETEAIRRRQAFAEALKSPVAQGGRMVGKHFVPMNPLSGLADLLRAKWGREESEGATKDQQALADRIRNKQSEEWAGVTEQMTGRPADVLPEGQQGPVRGAQAPDIAAAYARALKAEDPTLRQFGMQGMAQMPQMEERKAERAQDMDWRNQQAKAQIESANVAHQRHLEVLQGQNANAATMAEAQRAHAEKMQRLAAGMSNTQRAPHILQTESGPMQLIGGRAVPILGPDGKPVSGAKSGTANLSATAQKELFEADDMVQSGSSAISSLNQALKLNKDAYSGVGAGLRAKVVSNMPGQSSAADATIAFDNIIQNEALSSMKSIFGGNPTEGERAILLDLQASSSKTPTQREAIIKRAMQAAENRINFNQQKGEALRGGSYMKPGGAPAKPSGATGGWAITPVGP